MLVDLHLHEKTCSTDSFLSLEEIVSEARRRGLDGVCITDHDSMGLRDYAEDYARRTGFPIFEMCIRDRSGRCCTMAPSSTV